MKLVSMLLSLSCQLQEVNKSTFNLTIKKCLCLRPGWGGGQKQAYNSRFRDVTLLLNLHVHQI